MTRALQIGLLLLAFAAPACAAATEAEGEGATVSDISSTSLSPHATTVGIDGLALSPHTTLGFPEDASVSDPAHALLVRPQYVTSFDSHRKNPRWTSWELTRAWLGTAARTPAFVADTLLPSSIPQPKDSDFRSSGFQRGHLCPSADRTANDADNAATFVFTNVVPQTAQSNTGVWESLETAERTLARSGDNHVFVIAGSIYGDTRTIGDGVAVPTSMFKVVVVLHGDHPTPADVTSDTRVIAVEIPNTTTVYGNYTYFRTSLASLEAKTGFHFLSDVATDVHDAIAPLVDSQ